MRRISASAERKPVDTFLLRLRRLQEEIPSLCPERFKIANGNRPENCDSLGKVFSSKVDVDEGLDVSEALVVGSSGP